MCTRNEMNERSNIYSRNTPPLCPATFEAFWHSGAREVLLNITTPRSKDISSRSGVNEDTTEICDGQKQTEGENKANTQKADLPVFIKELPLG